ncbi:hypothetical protein LIER_19061 [Lithospermum erythrorhizon]|uniref:Uncharacterized protein n=1 Tax=Lithospermum erythrorhizon TaxID=34254 RepID=A0AAV3QGE5_LITER
MFGAGNRSQDSLSVISPCQRQGGGDEQGNLQGYEEEASLQGYEEEAPAGRGQLGSRIFDGALLDMACVTYYDEFANKKILRIKMDLLEEKRVLAVDKMARYKGKGIGGPGSENEEKSPQGQKLRHDGSGVERPDGRQRASRPFPSTQLE